MDGDRITPRARRIVPAELEVADQNLRAVQGMDFPLPSRWSSRVRES